MCLADPGGDDQDSVPSIKSKPEKDSTIKTGYPVPTLKLKKKLITLIAGTNQYFQYIINFDNKESLIFGIFWIWLFLPDPNLG